MVSEFRLGVMITGLAAALPSVWSVWAHPSDIWHHALTCPSVDFWNSPTFRLRPRLCILCIDCAYPADLTKFGICSSALWESEQTAFLKPSVANFTSRNKHLEKKSLEDNSLQACLPKAPSSCDCDLLRSSSFKHPSRCLCQSGFPEQLPSNCLPPFYPARIHLYTSVPGILALLIKKLFDLLSRRSSQTPWRQWLCHCFMKTLKCLRGWLTSCTAITQASYFLITNSNVLTLAPIQQLSIFRKGT